MPSIIYRVRGEAIDADQGEWICPGCDEVEHRCECDEPAPVCETCEGALTANGFCHDCDDFTLAPTVRIAPGRIAA